MSSTRAYAAQTAKDALAPYTLERRAPGNDDVQIDILYCGVCHSDLHTARDEWHITQFPCVPGHEIVGRVSAVGAGVSRFKVGDTVGVGCMVDSCAQCASCREGEEQYCEKGFTGTYNGPLFGGPNTFGGYSDRIVVKESFVLRIAPDQNLAAVAPLLKVRYLTVRFCRYVWSRMRTDDPLSVMRPAAPPSIVMLVGDPLMLGKVIVDVTGMTTGLVPQLKVTSNGSNVEFSADFSEATLTAADLRGADLSKAVLTPETLAGAKLDGATLPNSVARTVVTAPKPFSATVTTGRLTTTCAPAAWACSIEATKEAIRSPCG